MFWRGVCACVYYAAEISKSSWYFLCSLHELNVRKRRLEMGYSYMNMNIPPQVEITTAHDCATAATAVEPSNSSRDRIQRDTLTA